MERQTRERTIPIVFGPCFSTLAAPFRCPLWVSRFCLSSLRCSKEVARSTLRRSLPFDTGVNGQATTFRSFLAIRALVASPYLARA